MSELKRDISIVLCGEAGQGIQTVEALLVRILRIAGYHVFSTPEYMSRIRGGSNSTEIRVSARRVRAFVDRIDLFVPFSKQAISHLTDRLSPETVYLGERENMTGAPDGATILEVPFAEIATEVGGAIYANTVAAATIAALFQVAQEVVESYLREYFAGKSEEIIQNNIAAVQRGYARGQALRERGKLKIALERQPALRDELMLNGSDAMSMGALAGGCNFLSAYPMSPSTAVLVFMAQHGAPFGVIVEQAEDEIAAINMALGASYAGARAMVTTSGGGFALMQEATSLAGISETPIVIHLAQRPGPATGLPTRTEQGDLELALHSGHGEFPHILLTPGSIEDTFYAAQKAFDLAAKYQTPTFVLTDQYLLESSYNLPFAALRLMAADKHLIVSKADYQRYEITESGISPRAIPGYGDGLVVADSHTHTPDGHITEDPHVRSQMVDKRLRKLQGISAEALPAELIGPEAYHTLVVGWGSTYHVIQEALDELGRDDVAFLHFRQVFPIPSQAAAYLQKAQRRIVVENNATAQLGKLLKLYAGVEMDHRILKYDGRPFSVEGLTARLREALE